MKKLKKYSLYLLPVAVIALVLPLLPSTLRSQVPARSVGQGKAGSQAWPVSAAQSGTWNVNNISGTVSLPTGAATAAKQPALGTAGSASADVITIQGIASMTPLLAAQSGTWNINNISGTISLPTGAATAAKQPALGTAGSASADVITVQGVASMTPLFSQIRDAAGNARGVNVTASNDAQVQTNSSGNTGSAVPARANYMGGNVGGNLTGDIKCGSTAIYDASTTGSTQMVALSGSTVIYICGYAITVGGTATNVKLVYGTGTNCATSPANMTPAYQIAANGGIVDGANQYRGLKTAAGNALCINASAGNAVQAIVYYTQF